MMPRQVSAFSNSTVKLLRSLRDKKARRAEGLFLAEGLRILAEARDSGRLPEIVAFSPEGAKHPLAAEIIAATEAAGGDAIETSAEILSKMSGKDNPQMLLGAYRQPCFLLIGNEQQGLPADYEAECDLLVKIPMAGRADSLNAAMATAVMAFAIRASWR